LGRRIGQGARLRDRFPPGRLPLGHPPRPLLRLAPRAVVQRNGAGRGGTLRRRRARRAQAARRTRVMPTRPVDGARVVVSAPAKVNLRLRVLAREVSGYHQLETLFCALELADTLEIERAGRGIDLEVEGARLGPPEDNLV